MTDHDPAPTDKAPPSLADRNRQHIRDYIAREQAKLAESRRTGTNGATEKRVVRGSGDLILSTRGVKIFTPR